MGRMGRRAAGRAVQLDGVTVEVHGGVDFAQPLRQPWPARRRLEIPLPGAWRDAGPVCRGRRPGAAPVAPRSDGSAASSDGTVGVLTAHGRGACDACAGPVLAGPRSADATCAAV